MPIRPHHVAAIATTGLLLLFMSCNKSPSNGRGRSFNGFVDVTNTIRFSIGDAAFYYYYYGGEFGIVERIGSVTLLIGGTAMTTVAPGRIAGPLQGSILTSANRNMPYAPFSAQCQGTHSFEMVRR